MVSWVSSGSEFPNSPSPKAFSQQHPAKPILCCTSYTQRISSNPKLKLEQSLPATSSERLSHEQQTHLKHSLSQKENTTFQFIILISVFNYISLFWAPISKINLTLPKSLHKWRVLGRFKCNKNLHFEAQVKRKLLLSVLCEDQKQQSDSRASLRKKKTKKLSAQSGKWSSNSRQCVLQHLGKHTSWQWYLKILPKKPCRGYFLSPIKWDFPADSQCVIWETGTTDVHLTSSQNCCNDLISLQPLLLTP